MAAKAGEAVAEDEYIKEKCGLETLPENFEIAAKNATVFNVMSNQITMLPPSIGVCVCVCVCLCVAVCCGVLRCVAVCCGVLRCVAVCCRVLQCVQRYA